MSQGKENDNKVPDLIQAPEQLPITISASKSILKAGRIQFLGFCIQRNRAVQNASDVANIEKSKCSNHK